MSPPDRATRTITAGPGEDPTGGTPAGEAAPPQDRASVVSLDWLGLEDFRSVARAELRFDPDALTVLVGSNGAGKTNLVEAVAYLATLRSFRGAPREALVRTGCPRAIVRAGLHQGERALLVEAELPQAGRARAQINRQPVRRAGDLGSVFRVSVLSPGDAEMVRGGPTVRRRLLDDVLTVLHPRAGNLVDELERVLRQRASLLQQMRGRLTAETGSTLDVWDDRLDRAGMELARLRTGLCADLEPHVQRRYRHLAGTPSPEKAQVNLDYRPSWDGSLLDALRAARDDDVRRGVNGVGPHRDDVGILLRGLPSRTHASQGEQRSLALALALASHDLVTLRSGVAPLLLLDDVFAELDPQRSAALVDQLPAGQALLTTAGPLPAGIRATTMYHVKGDGVIEAGQP